MASETTATNPALLQSQVANILVQHLEAASFVLSSECQAPTGQHADQMHTGVSDDEAADTSESFTTPWLRSAPVARSTLELRRD